MVFQIFFLIFLEIIVSLLCSLSISMNRGHVQDVFSFISFTIFSIICWFNYSSENIKQTEIFVLCSSLINPLFYNWIFSPLANDNMRQNFKYFFYPDLALISRVGFYIFLICQPHFVSWFNFTQ